ncbi:MAG TPA: M28 family peptidase [Bryobacteraceae bacterium]|nr:M28 family peptidase [Bryobacteraceae bacterium]
MNRRHNPLFLAGSLLLAAASLSIVSAKRVEQAQPHLYIEHVKYLATPELQGRGAGTPGLDKAARYIADQFKRFGLQPAGENKTWWQNFRVTTNAKPGANNRLAAASTDVRLNTDYLPLSFSSNGEFSGPAVFAGYGITAPELHYDDYQHLDVKDRIVLILRYEPKHFRKDKAGQERQYTHHAHLVSKAINARNHGARAVILVNGEPDGKQEDRLIRFGSVAGPENAGILILQVRNAVANEWLRAAGKSLADLQRHIESSSAPASFALPDTLRITAQVNIEREQATVRNVIGYLPGRTKEYVIIGAHYDHLGLGNESSLAPSQIGQVHPGADDNASGTAGVIELARLLSARRNELTRGVLFMTFAGEEIGLLGSSQWVNHPTLPIENAVAMINMDMIGRVNGAKLYIGGTGTGSTFEAMLKEATRPYNFRIDYSQDGYSASDHTSFAGKSIPVLFFFSGLHGDYHKPSDTPDKISAVEAAQVLNLVADVATRLSTADARPQFVKVQAGPHGTLPSGAGGGGYGPYFGSIPDFAPVDKGVKFSDVRPGSPAAKAGLRGGDILVGFGDKPINNLYDFTFALRNSRVGDVVKVRYLRDGKELTTEVTLEERR